MTEIDLPGGDAAMVRVRLNDPAGWATASPGQPLCRHALAAAHVVADPYADITPFQESALDMERTLAFRRHLWSLGLGVAEAMDTAQRGMGLGWTQAKDLIAETAALARHTEGASVYSGVGTDHLGGTAETLESVTRAYLEQLDFVQKTGSRVIVMASRALTAIAGAPGDYAAVYDKVLASLEHPAILHWLGPMFDPALRGYWGTDDLDAAMDACLEVIHTHTAKVEGIKISLLDKDLEIAMRRRLPDGVRMYTGDDFNYPELIAGDGNANSDALLGIFDPIAAAASAALRALSDGNAAAFNEILAPTVPLAREIFAAPTQYYKTGVVFLAYLNGHQDHFVMVGGSQGARSLTHLVRVFRLADGARLLNDPAQAAHRLKRIMALHGIEA